MKTGILLLSTSAIFFYLGANQVAELGSTTGGYPASHVIGSFAPGVISLLAAVRRLGRALSRWWHMHHAHF